MKNSTQFTLSTLLDVLEQAGVSVQLCGGDESGNTDQMQIKKAQEFSGLGSLEHATATQLSFLANPKYISQLESSAAGAVFVKPDQAAACRSIALVTDNPYFAYAKTSQFIQSLVGDILDVAQGVHPTALIHESVSVGKSVFIGPGVAIGENAVIGDRVMLGAYTSIGKNVTIGAGSKLAPHVVLYADTHLGANCRIQSHTSIGADGFGYAPTAQGWEPIAQLGGVVLGDGVHVGANTSIDRGAIHPTEIHRGVIIDNQVQIAHNVVIGEYTAIAGCAGIAGSTRIGARCTLAGAAGVAGHLDICDGVHIGMQAQVTKSITEPGQYGSGTGLYPLAKWRRLVGRLRRLI